MPTATYTFPNGFLWGTATAAHQVEGKNINNWSFWEEQPGKIIHGDRAGLACDWWGGRWTDDFDRAAEAGQNAHRLSIEWSRVQPAADRWNDGALEVYRDMLRGLARRNMTALVTLHHFTDPLWLYEQGGWENPRAPEYFAAFVRRAVDVLKEYCSLWVTINEPNVYVYNGYLGHGEFPPGKNDLGAALRVMANLARGHALAYRAIHALQPTARVGFALHYRGFRPAHAGNPLEAWSANALNANFNTSFIETLRTGRLNFLFRSVSIPEARNTQDFVGLNYYTTDEVTFHPLRPGELFSKRRPPREAPLSEGGFIAHYPEGLFDLLAWAHRRYQLPMMVTENGINDAEDTLRPRYLAEHVWQVWRAIQWSWLIKGYFHWSLVDNFEWERGWSQRFGLWGVDPITQARQRKPSVDFYAAIAHQNALSYASVAKWAPDALPALFPE